MAVTTSRTIGLVGVVLDPLQHDLVTTLELQHGAGARGAVRQRLQSLERRAAQSARGAGGNRGELGAGAFGDATGRDVLEGLLEGIRYDAVQRSDAHADARDPTAGGTSLHRLEYPVAVTDLMHGFVSQSHPADG
jgi:hypothetical protein